MPIGPATEKVFLFKLDLLQEMSAKVRATIPEAVYDADMAAKWRIMGDSVDVVHPVSNLDVQENIRQWLRQTSSFLISGCNVALVSEYAVGRGLGLDLLAGWAKELGLGLAEVRAGQITPDQVTEMAAKAPGDWKARWTRSVLPACNAKSSPA